MPARPRLRFDPLHWLRLMALVLLSLGLLVKPVLVAACEVDDLRSAHGAAAVGTADMAGDAMAGSDEVVAAGTGDDAATASTGGTDADPAGDTCCPGKACSACCTSATVLPLALVASIPAPVPGHVEALAALAPGPVTHPVDVRPPISA